MDRGERLTLITGFIREIEHYIHVYKGDRQPPIEEIVRHVNVLFTEHKLSIRIYWKDGYEIEYNESKVDNDIDYLLDVYEQFVSEYDTLLLPAKPNIKDDYECMLQDNQ